MESILILGGTGFVGRILSEKLINSDYSVTLFNRGKRNANLFPEFTKIKGDRNTEDIFKIASGNWDVVFDFSGFFPDNLETVTSLLKNNAGRYIFISSASVYDVTHPSKLKYPTRENSPVLKCTPEQKADKHPFNFYGNKKAECERILLRADWLDVIIFRPALIYGKYDPTDRFYYWLYRAKNQDRILLPDDGITEQTNTYSEDFASLLLKAIEIEEHKKIYNAVTHPALSIKSMVSKMCAFFNSDPELINASSKFLEKNNVSEWNGISLWIKDYSYVLDNTTLLNDFNIKFNSFEQSLAQTIDYYDKLNWYMPKDGISLTREKELIEILKSS